jgi:hypothetical protein
MLQAGTSPTSCGQGALFSREDCTALAAQPNSCYTGFCTSDKVCEVKAAYVLTSHFCNCFMLIQLNSADAHSTHSFTPFAPKALKYVVHLLVFVIWQNSVME